jgi:magnesium transporter
MKKPIYLLRPLRPLVRGFRRPPPGSSPGTLSAPAEAEPPLVTYIAYGAETIDEGELDGLDQLARLRREYPVVWVNVDNVEHVETVRALGREFGLHRLALEDVVHVPQRPKVEDYGEYLFLVARMAQVEHGLETEQLGMFVGRGFVLSFLENPGDPLDPVRARIRSKVGRIRDAGADYLAYAVVDAVIDHYFPVLETLGDRLDELEQQIVGEAPRTVMGEIYLLKRELTGLRRAIWPMRDAMNVLVRDPHPVVEDETRIYLRDCYDQVVQCIDLVESYRDLTASMSDLYLSVVGQRTNETMRVLTVFASIFIPLTFIAGVWGMNFDPDVSPLNMPELRWYLGYPFALGLMAAVTVATVAYFWRKGWLTQ